ncbi:hypothetical protein SAMN06264365_10596 [Actinoplanes regularis]|uniref:Uncharacterized protein n=1 Tax=Actinoplanes regularis TaxID=52697 RepID=A0A238YSA4_9ACTN|nr:hypothetical protein Are01nite_19560 [Actinoplanes regularis]SNR73309.1 hypothetical protein SAMN06264365_10596 [Actinoplanes regularis]
MARVVDETVARLPIHNHGSELLEVVLEPYGRDYHLRSDETLIVHTAGTTRESEPFGVDFHPDFIQVHFNGAVGWVTGPDGNELDCGHQRP